MSFFSKIFTRGPEGYLSKGEGYLASHSFYEARTAFEAGLQACRGKSELDEIAKTCADRICEANRAMAELNLQEAEHALRLDNKSKAVEHLELAKTLTDDRDIREKADKLLVGLNEVSDNTEVLESSTSCSSCSHGTPVPHEELSETDVDLSAVEHYELLLHQLPDEMSERYSLLGEEFACMFIAASLDRHQEALDLLEQWFDGSNRDIYCYEKGKVLHRLGRISDAESCLRESISENALNPLPHLGLALLLVDDNRLEAAASHLEAMIDAEIFTGQALMMRGEVFELAGDNDAAIALYGRLLETSLARAAAERLHDLLLESDRKPEAAHIYKRYLNKCSH